MLKIESIIALGRAIRWIFCSAFASQKDAAAIPFAGQKYVQKTTYKTTEVESPIQIFSAT
ncbi:hypothetical protein GENT5_19930 [Flavobacterium ammoniigenes]|uniref:Uncharacterized protein n=1 Tax=Flavobacterium ammoniigenes TaxID=1751095 RepID=A0ABN6L5R3_9FLAO|nr:hypothetical protein GENT5_19930 [Flavobacterium ammoniigenes]